MENNYELTVVLKVDLMDEGKEAFIKKIEKVVKALDGVTGKVMEMGKKQLSYRINGQNEGIYVNIGLELPTSAVVELERKLKVDSDVLRHLIVKV